VENLAGVRSNPSSAARRKLYNDVFHLKAERKFDRDKLAMPKQKTHKGTKKRFRITASGKLKHRQAGTSHLNSRMSQKRKRNLRGTKVLAKADTKRIRAALNGHSY
jgi:large subunit ribosomal protein L35